MSTKDGMQHPDVQKVRAVEVVPYLWGIWSSVENSKPFVNTVMGVSWSEGGDQIILGLESFNFYFANPDEEVELVPIPPMPHRANYPPFVLPPRPSWTTCEHCGHRARTKPEGTP